MSNYDLIIIDAHTRLPNEPLGHLIGIESAKYCADNGKSVLVITSSFSHMMKSQRTLEKNTVISGEGYDVLIISTNSYFNHISLKRIFWHLTVMLGILLRLNTLKGAKVISFSSPIPFLDFFVPLIKKYSGSKIVIQVRDLWPEHFETVPLLERGYSRKLVFRLFRYMRKRMLAVADSTISVSEGTRSVAQSHSNHSSHHIVPNVTVSTENFSGVPALPREYFSPTATNIINYSGTFGEGYDIELLVLAVNELTLENRLDANLVITGDGPKRAAIMSLVESLDNPAIRFLGIISKEEFFSLIMHTGLGILPYVKNTAVDFPAKFFDYIVSGTPVIHSLEGELREFTTSSGCGIFFEPGDKHSLKSTLIEALDQKKLKTMESNMRVLSPQYSKEVQLKKFDNIYS